MARTVKVITLDRATGRALVRFTDADGVAAEASIDVPPNDDGSARTVDQMLDFLADHWPAVDIKRRRKATRPSAIASAPTAAALVGASRDITARLAARGK